MYSQQPFRPEDEYGTKRRFNIEIPSTLDDVRRDFKIPSPKVFYDLIREIDDPTATVVLPNGEHYSADELSSEVMPAKELTVDFCDAMSKWILNNSGYPGVVFATIHGSFLYGTAKEDSDVNTFVVYTDDEAIVQADTPEDEMELEVIAIPLVDFAKGLAEGKIQYVEALYSPYAVFSDDETEKNIMEITVARDSFAQNALKKAEEDRSQAETEADDSGALKYLRSAKRLEEAARTMRDEKYTPVWKPLEGEK